MTREEMIGILVCTEDNSMSAEDIVDCLPEGYVGKMLAEGYTCMPDAEVKKMYEKLDRQEDKTDGT